MQPYEQLEVEFGRFMGLDNMVACSSGTAALHLALETVRLPPRSEVLVPDYTMVACARAVVLAGLTPVFVDCGDDLLMDPLLVRSHLVNSDGPTSIALVVHIYGRRCDMFRLRQPIAERGLFLIEDMAEIHGIRPHDTSHAACWSFYRNKIIAGEEGGAVAFYKSMTWQRDKAKELRSLGFTSEHDFNHVPRGHNYRLANALAKPILESLERYEANVRQRRVIEGWYDRLCPLHWKMPAREAPWVYDLRVPGLTRERQKGVVRTLNENGIEARMGFWPMSFQQEFRGCRYVGGKWDSPEHKACMAGHEVFYLPLTPYEVTQEKAERAFTILHKLLD